MSLGGEHSNEFEASLKWKQSFSNGQCYSFALPNHLLECAGVRNQNPGIEDQTQRTGLAAWEKIRVGYMETAWTD